MSDARSDDEHGHFIEDRLIAAVRAALPEVAVYDGAQADRELLIPLMQERLADLFEAHRPFNRGGPSYECASGDWDPSEETYGQHLAGLAVPSVARG